MDCKVSSYGSLQVSTEKQRIVKLTNFISAKLIDITEKLADATRRIDHMEEKKEQLILQRDELHLILEVKQD